MYNLYLMFDYLINVIVLIDYINCFLNSCLMYVYIFGKLYVNRVKIEFYFNVDEKVV